MELLWLGSLQLQNYELCAQHQALQNLRLVFGNADRRRGMAPIFLAGITMAYGLQEGDEPGWRPCAERRVWLKTKVKGEGMGKEKRLGRDRHRLC